jgi:hypothetical protein
VPILAAAVEKTILGALSLDLPPDHRIKPLGNAKREEHVAHILTRSAVEWAEPLFPGVDGEAVWMPFTDEIRCHLWRRIRSSSSKVALERRCLVGRPVCVCVNVSCCWERYLK